MFGIYIYCITPCQAAHDLHFRSPATCGPDTSGENIDVADIMDLMTGNQVHYPTIHGRSTVQAYARRVAPALVDKDAAALAAEVAAYAKLPLTKYAYFTIESQATINTPRLVSVSCVIEFWNGHASHSFLHYDSCAMGLVHGHPKVLTVHDLFRNRVDAVRTSERAALAALAQTGTDRDLKRYKKAARLPVQQRCASDESNQDI